MNPPSLFLVLVAAGEGSRLGASTRKAAVEIAGAPLAVHALRTLAGTPGAIAGVIVVHADDLGTAEREWLPRADANFPWSVVAGGPTRAASTARGIACSPADATLLLVHDAARPLLDPADRDAVIAQAREHGSAILAAPVPDTLKRVEGELIVGEVDRSNLWGAQTPQVFTREVAARAAEGSEMSATDEAGWLAGVGVAVRVVAARSPNPKVTNRSDLAVVEAMLRNRGT